MRNDDTNIETRQERREKKLRKKRDHLSKHSKNLVMIYRDAILKRLRGKGDSNKSRGMLD